MDRSPNLPASAWKCLYTAAMQLYIANHVSYASFVAMEALETIEPDVGLVDELRADDEGTGFLTHCISADDEGTGFLTHCISDQVTMKIIQTLCMIKSGPELRKTEKGQRNIYLKKLKDEHNLSIGGSLD